MNNQNKKFYDFDKGCMVKEKKISKNLLNAQYTNIVRNPIKNKINMYLHTDHKTDTYYEKLYDNDNKNLKNEYKIDTTLMNLSYSDKIKKWKEMI
tara:strand:+ start:125 stop:409 length:285 start_codon:yes stop_codon:yes gene_type:complete